MEWENGRICLALASLIIEKLVVEIAADFCFDAVGTAIRLAPRRGLTSYPHRLR